MFDSVNICFEIKEMKKEIKNFGGIRVIVKGFCGDDEDGGR